MPNRPVSSIVENKRFVAVPGTATVREVARLMKEQHISAVMVVGRKQLLTGVCAERDLIFGVVAEGLDPDCTPVSAVMTEHPQTIAPSKPFAHALHLMYEGGFHHIPVVDDDGRPLGILSARDALQLDALQFGDELTRREEITVIL